MTDNDYDQETRLEKLRAEVRNLGGSSWVASEMPADLEVEFLKQVLEYEKAEPITLFHLLENAGLMVPPPDSLSESEITTKLWELIQRMSSLGAYLLHTDHLSDRELYEHLFNESLREAATLFPENPSYAYVIDVTGSGSDADNQLYFRYYADEDYRREWARDWPADPMPEHEEPPFDRDCRLPQSPIS